MTGKELAKLLSDKQLAELVYSDSFQKEVRKSPRLQSLMDELNDLQKEADAAVKEAEELLASWRSPQEELEIE